MDLSVPCACQYRKGAVPEVSAESTSISLPPLLLAGLGPYSNSLHTGSSHNSTSERSRSALNYHSQVLAVPFPFVTSRFFSFGNKGRRKVDDAAGKGRWEQAAVPRAPQFPYRRAAISRCHTANPALASCALGVLS